MTTLRETLDAAERRAVAEAILQHRGHLGRAAVALGLSRAALTKRLEDPAYAGLRDRLARAVELGWELTEEEARR